jgi:hypothetical protein
MRRRRRVAVIAAVAVLGVLAALAVAGGAAELRMGSRDAGDQATVDLAGDAGTMPGLVKVPYGGELGEAVKTYGDEAAGEDGVETVASDGAPPAAFVGDGRDLLRTADIGIVIAGHDVTAAADRVVLITRSLAGYVVSSWTGTRDDPVIAYPEEGDVPVESGVQAREGIETATVTLRVPARSFETALRRFSRLGDVEYRQTSTEDVTTQMVDLEARLRHARAVERRLLRFLEATSTIREMLAVQDRLDQVQLEIEQLTAQLASLREVVDFSTITVTLRAQGDTAPVIGETGGVWDNFVDAWRLIGRGARLFVLAAAAALPFVIVIGTLGLAVWYGRRRFGRRPADRAGAEGAA